MSVWEAFKVVIGFGAVPNICEMSKSGRDYHDYPKHKGGDGVPSHFYTYKCWNCGKEFRI